MASMAPARMRSTTTELSTSSPRNLGKTMPRLTAPTWWPARPMRCRPDATELGDSTWMTRSTAPMSMPSSRELGATPAGRGPPPRGRAPGLGALLDLGALLAADRAVVGPGQLGLGELVEVGAEPLGQAAGVGEHDGRGGGLGQLQHPLPRV